MTSPIIVRTSASSKRRSTWLRGAAAAAASSRNCAIISSVAQDRIASAVMRVAMPPNPSGRIREQVKADVTTISQSVDDRRTMS